jgi:cellulose synthase/poly-beta-1,6-N-acetylglucosamine synthase-like glycosyltransferase
MNGYGIDINWIPFILLFPYLFVTARIVQGLSGIKPSVPKRSCDTQVSVIIPTIKGPDSLGPLLSDLALQDYNHDSLEIIIADDSEGLWEGNEGQSGKDLLHFRVVRNTGKGKKSALACAIGEATGELIVTTDDDCSPGREWILTIASHYHARKPGMIICPVELSGPKGFFTAMQQLEFASLQGVTAGSAALGDPLICNGAGLAFRRDLYPGKGSFLKDSLSSGDDVFLLHHLKKRGIRIEWLESERAIVRTAAAGGISQFLRQRARWSSKALYYNDTSTLLTGLAVFIACIVIALFLVMSLFNTYYIRYAMVMLLVKSLPDILIIMNRLQFHGRMELLRYFPPVQIVYPFYVIISVVAGLFRRKEW